MSRLRQVLFLMLVAFGLAAAGVIATVLIQASVTGSVPDKVEGTNPATAALRRCREEGERAVSDPACQAAWNAARAAFFGGGGRRPTA